MNTHRPLKELFFLVFVGLGLGLGFNFIHTEPLPWIGKTIETVFLEDLQGSDTPPGGEPTETTSGAPTGDPGNADMAETGDIETSGSDVTHDTGTQTTMETTPQTGDGKSPPPSRDLYRDIPESEFPIQVGLAKAKELYDRGGLLVLDAREPEEFAEGHVAGAVSAPADYITGDVDWMDKTAADKRPILVYCGGGDCELSLTLGFELAKTGHPKVLIYEDGFPAWEEAGYPVETGEMP